MTIRELVASVLLLSGVGLSVIAAVGIHRFPDVFARMHAATKPVTLGLLLVLVGTAVRVGGGDVGILLLVAAFQLVTAPVSAHVLARAAYRSGDQLDPGTRVDELAEARREGGSDPAEPPA